MVSQILVLVFQQYMLAESAVRLDGVSAMEQPLRPARAFEDAVNTLRSWQSKLRIVLHDFGCSGECSRECSQGCPCCREQQEEHPREHSREHS